MVQKQEQCIEWVPLKVIKHQAFSLQCNHKTPEAIELETAEYFASKDILDALITIRLSGTLSSGRVSDINFKHLLEQLYANGAYFIMKNTANLQSEAFEEIKIAASDPESMEEEIIKEHLQQNKVFDQETELYLAKTILHALNTSKKEGETVSDFQERIIQEMERILNL